MLELAEMDKREMENEYADFARQYNEMKTQVNNDSLMAQLEHEQQRAQELLEELRRTKSNDAAEIARLKKELATMRQVLKSFVAEIDSLNRLNTQLMGENENLRQQHERRFIARISTLRHTDVREIGAEHLCCETIKKLRISEFLQRQGFTEEQTALAVTQIAIRATHPASEGWS